MKTAVVAVLDVGKTNKKVNLFDRSFALVASERTAVETTERDGLEVERADELLSWLRGTLKGFSHRYDIRAISITTHGATYALLDDSGKLAFPVISYTTDKGPEFEEEFYAKYGSRHDLQRATGTLDLGFANLSKSMYYLRTRLPEVWARCRRAVFYPQYLGYELTGKIGMEPTYLGNHNYLWDMARNTWSSVAKDLGADALFPSTTSAPWDALGTVRPDIADECGLPRDCRVTLGIHDSNANFLPYLAQGRPHDMLNSTGTWCVAMCLADKPALTDDEIAVRIFFNLDALGRPVKTAVFPGGMEYEVYGGFTSVKDDGDLETVARVLREQKLFVIPGVLPTATIFPGVEGKVVQGDRAWLLKDLRNDAGQPMTALGPDYCAALNISLALQSSEILRRAGARAGTTVYIEGGFTRNRPYCELLPALLQGASVSLTNMQEGTSFGAALCAWMMLEGRKLEEIGREFTIESHPIAPRQFPDLEAYARRFFSLVR